MEIQFLTEINTNKTIQKWGISCVGNADVPHYVVSAHAKEKNSKKIEKQLTFRHRFVIIILALSDRAKLIKSH